MFYVLNNWPRRSDARSYRPALPSRFYDGYGHPALLQALQSPLAVRRVHEQHVLPLHRAV